MTRANGTLLWVHRQLQDIVRTLKAKGASLRATEQPIDTSTAAGKCFLDMLGAFAEFETNLRRERQLDRAIDRMCQLATSLLRLLRPHHI
jgi:Resolvase, N terminal domain